MGLQEDLSAYKQRYESIVQNISVCLHEIDIEGNMLSMNAVGLKLIGVKKETDVVGKPYINLVAKQDKHRLEALLELALQGESSKFEFQTTSEKPQWFSSSFIPIMDNEGKVLHILGMTSDITESRLVKEQSEKSEQQLKEAARIAQLGHYVFDIVKGSWTASSVLRDIFGIDENFEKDIAGWLNMVHPDYKESMGEYLQVNILTHHEKFNREYRIIDQRTGEEKWVHGLGQLEFNENGELTEMLGTIQDITERKRKEEQLGRSQLRLKEEQRFTQHLLDATDTEGGSTYFDELTALLCTSLKVKFVFVGECRTNKDDINIISFAVDGVQQENFSYTLKDTPCETVFGKELCAYPKNVQRLFPKDEDLKAMGVDSYVGAPLSDIDGNPIGLIVVMDEKSIENVVG
ncbi:MAG: PAS domain S-box protein, partial [Flavobacteriales bacterium]|nr:PAS domain S-box protein [Flavobacteriales bacterium]